METARTVIRVERKILQVIPLKAGSVSYFDYNPESQM